MKYLMTIDSDKQLAAGGVIMARAQGCIGFNEQVWDAKNNLVAFAIGWREDSIPKNNTRVLVPVDESVEGMV